MYNPQELNFYSYTANNPIRYTDPTGMCLEDDLCISEAATAVVVLAISALASYVQTDAFNDSFRNVIKSITPSWATQTQAQAVPRDIPYERAVPRTKAEEKNGMTFYRGDWPGQKVFIANGILNGFGENMEGLSPEAHIKDSTHSAWISITTSWEEAARYATNNGQHIGSVYIIILPAEMFPIKAPGNSPTEFLIPIVIPRNFIIKETPISK